MRGYNGGVQPAGYSGLHPDAGREDLDGGIRPAGLLQPGECHHTPIPQRRHGRVPATVRHALHVSERAGQWIKDGVARLPVEGIVLNGSAVDQRSAIGQDDHAIAEHVPGDRLRHDGAGVGIPDSSLEIRIACDIA